MNEGIYDTGALQCEIARLHEELAKANGACADMAAELRTLVDMIEESEEACDWLQRRCEVLGAQLDQQREVNRQLMDPIVRAKMVEPPPPVVMHICPECGGKTP